MKNIVNTYIDKFRNEKRTRTRIISTLTVLALVVSGTVFWQLHSTGVAMANETYCGMEEHIHSEEAGCYEKVLICELDDTATVTPDPSSDNEETVEAETAAEQSEGENSGAGAEDLAEAVSTETEPEKEETAEALTHVHDESCYELVLVCDIPEHTHSVTCMIDETADVEKAEDWEATLPELTGIWADDVVSVAQSQVGYTESEKNFQLAEDGETHQGYTRYGAWYGNEYGDWDAMFVSFVLHYADVPEDSFLEASGAYAWVAELKEAESKDETGELQLFAEASEYTPKAGDLIFFDNDKDDEADHVGIVTARDEETLSVIEGDCDDKVCENKYSLDDEAILGYALLPAQGAPEGTEIINGDTLYSASDSGVNVSVIAPADALPEGAELSVKLLNENSEEYAEAAEVIGMDVMTLSAGDETGKGMAVLDISFMQNGEEAEPTAPVQVTLDVSAIVPEDTGTITVQHLVETDGGVEPEVVARVSADDPVAEFEVGSFSKFTIEWNDGTGTSITVHVYTVDGIGIEEVLDTEYSHDGGDILIADIVEHLHGSVSSTHYEYATVYYETSNGMNGYDAYTIGSESDSVTEISKSGTTYTITFESGTTQDVSNPASIDIHLYYSIPTVTIETDNGHSDAKVDFTTTNQYFKGLGGVGSTTTYSWSLSDDSKGSIDSDEQGGATFTWSDVSVGDSVTITVIMTNTYTDDEGKEIIETASDAYTLIYGAQAVTITVFQSGGTLVVGEYARVALVDENGNTVATGTTGSDGTVTLYAIPGTYTVGVTYIADNGTGPNAIIRYTGETTEFVVTDNESEQTGTVTLDSGVAGSSILGSSNANEWVPETPYYYDHVDVKVAVVGEEGASVEFSELDKVYVYDKYGNLIYWSEDLIANEDTTDYNCEFDYYENEDTHFIVVTSEDTVAITYEVLVTYDDGTSETKTYTITMKGNGTYGEGEYYGYENVNAFQLYNCINQTNITEAQWDAALEAGTLEELLGDNYNEDGIHIGGLYYLQVADYLCDTRASSQAGLDFVIDVEAVDDIIFDWDFAIAKSYAGVPENLVYSSQFGFTLTEAEVTNNENTWVIDEDATVYSATTEPNNWIYGDDNTYSNTAKFDSQEFETTGGTDIYYYILQENPSSEAEANNPYYGIKVSVTVNATTGLQSMTVSYCVLNLVEVNNEAFNMSSEGWTEIFADTSDDVYYLPFVNTYRSESYPIDIYKYYTSGEVDEGERSITVALSGAEFTLSYTEINVNTEESTRYFATFDNTTENYTFVGWLSENDLTEESVYVLTSGSDGYIHVDGLTVGTYTLTEITAPDGYYLLDADIIFTIEADGNVSVSEDTSNASVGNDSDVALIAVENIASAELPVTGGVGTTLYTMAGLLLMCSAAYLLYSKIRKERRYQDA